MSRNLETKEKAGFTDTVIKTYVILHINNLIIKNLINIKTDWVSIIPANFNFQKSNRKV